MAKAVFFKTYPDFLPMMNPAEIIQIGGFGGNILTPNDPIPQKVANLLTKFNTENRKFISSRPRPNNNYFEVLGYDFPGNVVEVVKSKPDHSDEEEEVLRIKLDNRISWFRWYMNFYSYKEKREKSTTNTLMISQWKIAVKRLYDLYTLTEDKKYQQSLLEYGWWITHEKPTDRIQ